MCIIKMNPPEQDNQQTQETPTGDTKGKRKIWLPCMVCDTQDHYTKYFPHLKEVQQYLKEHPNQSEVLTNPFPAQQ